MVWAYAWLKVGYFPSPLAGILAVDDGRVRYTARSDDPKARSAAAEQFGRPELVDELASTDGAVILDCSAAELEKVKFPASQMGGAVMLKIGDEYWKFFFYVPPTGGLDSSGAQAFAGAMKGKRESAALRAALKEL